MQHLMRIFVLLLAIIFAATQAQHIPYAQSTAQYREQTDFPAERLRTPYPNTAPNFNANNYPNIQAPSDLYAPQPYPERVLLFHNQRLQAPATIRDQQPRQPTTYTQFQSAAPPPMQLWSGPPIVVGYNEGAYADREQQLLEQRKYTGTKPETLPSPPVQLTSAQNTISNQFRNNIDANNFDSTRSQLPAHQQRQQVTPSGSLPSFYPQRYANHFENYVRKYPYRLQPIFSPSDYGMRSN